MAKPKKRLNVLYFPWFRPILDNLDFLFGHVETSRREDISQIFYGVNGELALVGADIETVLSETVEDFVDMLPVLGGRVGID